MIILCPYDRIETAMERHAPGAAISILDTVDGMSIDGIPPERHLKIGYSMANAASDSRCSTLDDADTLREMIAFARDADWDKPLLVHCRLGLSRSPAAVFIIQCALSPDTPESQFAEELRQLSTKIEPSFSMICQADQILDRDGRMIDAMDMMGAGAGCVAGDILRIPYLPQKG